MDAAPVPTPTDATTSPPDPAPGLRSERWARVAGPAAVAVLCGLAFAFGRDAGAIWDDDFHRVNGENILRWFASGFSDRSVLTTGNLYLYGGLFDAPAALIARWSPLDPFATRHVLTALVGVLGVTAVFKTAALLAGRRAGFLAASLLVLTPAWTGHALMNPKDVPYASFAAWAVYAAVRIAVAPAALSWRSALLAGLTVGAAAGVRSGGLSLLVFVFAAVGGRALVSREARLGWAPRGRAIASVAARLAAIVIVAWAVMVSFWPWAQLAPLTRPLQGIAESARFSGFDDWVLFGGAWLRSNELPRSYLPVWFAITLPEVWVLAAAGALVAGATAVRRGGLDRRRCVAVGVVAAAALGPIAAAMVLRPVLYDAHRHFLFVLPPAAVICGAGLSAFLSSGGIPRWVRRWAAAGAGALALLAVTDSVRLHPYEYVFVNHLAGGLEGAAGRYEADYWGASYREGVQWVVDNVAGASRPIRVAGCSLPFQVGHYLDATPKAQGRFELDTLEGAPDLLIATTRWDCHRRRGRVLHVVEREGVPLLYVIALSPPG